MRTCPKIIVFGDSLTQYGFSPDEVGWVSRLANMYTARCDVVCRGFSGYNTNLAVSVLPHVFPIFPEPPPHSPLLATVFFGANDASFDSFDQHVPIGTYVGCFTVF